MAILYNSDRFIDDFKSIMNRHYSEYKISFRNRCLIYQLLFIINESLIELKCDYNTDMKILGIKRIDDYIYNVHFSIGMYTLVLTHNKINILLYEQGILTNREMYFIMQNLIYIVFKWWNFKKYRKVLNR